MMGPDDGRTGGRRYLKVLAKYGNQVSYISHGIQCLLLVFRVESLSQLHSLCVGT